MSVRVTRAAAAAASAQPDHDTDNNGIDYTPELKASRRGKKAMQEEIFADSMDSAHDIALPDSSMIDHSDSQILTASINGTKRSASGSKQPILIAMDENRQTPARPGSPEIDFNKSILKPKGQAKQLIAQEKKGMRATSNKENMAPGSPAHAGKPREIVEVHTRLQQEAEHSQDATSDSSVSEATAGEAGPIEANQEEQINAQVAPVDEPVAKSPSPGAVIPSADQAPTQQAAPTTTAAQSAKQAAAKRMSTSKPATTKRLSHRPRPSHVGPQPDLPHSKPRPMSLSFPTPPPPQKSSKAPTRSTFQLPGEAVAAKLKAAREARQASASAAKDTESEAKKPLVRAPSFKARPAPKMDGVSRVRQTASSRARLSLASGEAAVLGRGASGRCSLAPAAEARRASVAGTVARPRGSMATAGRARPQSVIFPSTSSTSSGATSRSIARPRPSMGGKEIARGADGRPKSEKGKAVFDRAKVEREEAERKKREKEDAGRKARELASKMGRERSKAWAAKKAGTKPAVAKVEEAGVAA